ncbi:MAG TPA: ankyrin repeat domain-containing protein [Telluria sp.]|nr:ankyrin repeat domain-containing protein [Telluria sp.]
MRLFAAMLFAASLLAPTAALADQRGDFFRAVKVDDDRMLKRLFSENIDPNIVDPERGENALIVAVREDAKHAFRMLMAHPAIRVDEPAANGNTALMMAALKGNRTAALMLIERGAAVNRAGWTPLHYAAASGQAEIAKLLLERRADIDARAPTGATPLMMAAQEGQGEMVRLLLARGANAYLLDNSKRTALRIAELVDKRSIAADLAAHMAAGTPPKAAPIPR